MMARIVDPISSDAWMSLVSEQTSDVFHSPEWMRALRETYGFEPRAVIVERDGHPVAGMPFCEITDLRGERTVSLPFSDSCDPLVSTIEDWNVIAEALQALGHPINLRVLHNTIPLEDPRFKPVNRARWHELDLGADIETLWAGIDTSARRAVRRARKEGVEVRPARGKDELRDFFDLHLRTRKYKYNLLAQPYAFFESIWDKFVEPGHGTLLVALVENTVIGGIFFLEWRGTLHYKFNASDPLFVNLRPNDLVLWTAAENGVAAGIDRIDFGLSDWDQEGLLRYKRKYATTEKTITMLRHDPSTANNGVNADFGAVLATLTDLLTDESVPDDVTEQAGDVLYRFFA